MHFNKTLYALQLIEHNLIYTFSCRSLHVSTVPACPTVSLWSTRLLEAEHMQMHAKSTGQGLAKCKERRDWCSGDGHGLVFTIEVPAARDCQ